MKVTLLNKTDEGAVCYFWVDLIINYWLLIIYTDATY